MTVAQIVDALTARLRMHEAEAEAFESEVARERGLFESSCALKFHEGSCEALTEVLDVLAVHLQGKPAAERSEMGVTLTPRPQVEPGSTG